MVGRENYDLSNDVESSDDDNVEATIMKLKINNPGPRVDTNIASSLWWKWSQKGGS